MKSWHDQAVEVGCQMLDLQGTNENSRMAILDRRNARIVHMLGQEGGIPALLGALREIAEKRPKHAAQIQEHIDSAQADQDELEILADVENKLRTGEFAERKDLDAYLAKLAEESPAGARVWANLSGAPGAAWNRMKKFGSTTRP